MVAYSAPNEQGKSFLEHIPEKQRSAVMNAFLRAVRAGYTTPESIVRQVLHELRTHLRDAIRERVETDTQGLQHLILAVVNHPTEALALAQYTLEWEQLSPAEKAHIKDQPASRHRQQWLASQPPTEKQMAFLRTLGHQGTVSSKAEASRLIGELKGGTRHA